MLPGLMMPPGLMSGGGGGPVLSYTTRVTSTAATINVPSSINPGDILVLIDRNWEEEGTPSDVIPSGFTKIHTSTTSSGGGDTWRTSMSWKRCTGSEGGSTLTGLAVEDGVQKCLLVFNGGGNSGATLGGAGFHNPGSGSTVSLVVNSSAAAAPVIAVAAFGSRFNTGSPAPSGNGDSNTGIIGGIHRFVWATWKVMNASPSNLSISWGASGGNSGARHAIGAYISAS